MGKVVFLGHGAFDTDSNTYPGVGEILVPPGTTIKFYSDAGHTLRIPATRDDSGHVISDYKKIVGHISGWESFQEDQGSLSEGQVTYNFRLSPETYGEERELAESLDWGGAEIVSLPKGSDKYYLCQGTPDTCPTPALLVDKNHGVEVPADRWKHHCTGIFGENEYAGNELYWMVCTSLYAGALQEWKDLLAGGDHIDPDVSWEPDEAAFGEIRKLNTDNIKETEGGGSVSVAAGGKMVLIGEGHSSKATSYVSRQADVEKGTVTVTKGGAFSKGSMSVKGISAKQALVKSEIGEFSDKKVAFA